MSRSRAKKYRICNTHTKMKRLANKKVRQTKDILDGNEYKKLFCSYNINDSSKAKPIPEEDYEWIEKAKRK